MLGEMAEHQAQGTPFTAEQMAFINQAVQRAASGCGAPTGAAAGTRAVLRRQPHRVRPDHRRRAHPADRRGGNPVGRVLHVGTGYARLMVLTVNTCTGPRAYAGLVSSYFEEVTENFERLDDPTWEKRF